MSVMPRKKYDKITWCELRVAPWTAHTAEIGTTPPDVAAFVTKVQTARAAATAAEEARIAAASATVNLNTAIAAMDVAAQSIMKQVRAKAEATANPDVYALAAMPVPATPSQVGNPGTAYDFKVELLQDGSLDLSWKCENPRGCTHVVYQVWRRVGLGQLACLGGSGDRKFLDTTIPPGATLLTYQIQAVRSTGVGNWATFSVSFGPVTPGMPAGTFSVSGSPRAAA